MDAPGSGIHTVLFAMERPKPLPRELYTEDRVEDIREHRIWRCPREFVIAWNNGVGLFPR